MTAQGQPPTWVTEVVGPVREGERLRWGFTNESWRVATEGGGSLVITRLADPAVAREIVERGPGVSAALREVGIATPLPIPDLSAPELAVITSAFIPGRSGMELIGRESDAEGLGRRIGGAWLALGRVATAGLRLDDLWARPNDLGAAAERWLAAAAGSVDASVASEVSGRIPELPRLLAGRRPGFVHGDLVPANVLVDDGRLAALLDLETVRFGERLLDAAWFRWIVRHHHPDVVEGAWRGFVDASGIDDTDASVGALLELLPMLRVLEILARPGLDAHAGQGWLDQLHAWARRNGPSA